MRIKIEKVTGAEVTFSCAYGDGKGFYADMAPEEDTLRHVEINILPTLIIGVNTFVSNENKQFVRIEGDETVFSVRVESMDEEDVWLRLSNDFVLVVEEIKGHVSIGDVLHVKLKPDEMAIYMIGG